MIFIINDGSYSRVKRCQWGRGFLHGGLRLNMQARKLSQFALARVERAEFGCAQHQCSRHVQNVQGPGANHLGVVFRQVLRFPNQFPPQVGLGHQQARRQVLLDLLPSRQRLRGSHSLLEYGKAQRISELNAMEASETNGNRICLPPRIRPGGVGVRDVKGEKDAGVSVDVHHRSSSRPSRTMLGSTLSPRIMRLRAA